MGLVFPAALSAKHCPVGCLPHQRANWATYAGTAPTELNMANEDIPVFPTDSLLWPDTGYRGYLPTGVIMTYQPGRKLKNQEGGAEDMSFNREVLAIRVQVEGAIGALRRSNIISDIYRNRRADFEDKVSVWLTQL